MPSKTSCVFCGENTLEQVHFSEKIAHGRRKHVVEGLLKMRCANCGEEVVNDAQSVHNLALTEASASTTQAAIYPGFIRSLREAWNLTQRQAARLFGAGETSVAKWEGGQVPSGPAALLLQCAVSVPGVMEHLSTLAGMSIRQVDSSGPSATKPSGYRANVVRNDRLVWNGCVNQRALRRTDTGFSPKYQRQTMSSRPLFSQ